MAKSAILALATGEIFHGKAHGGEGSAVGELVFNTAMSGYQEIITDPSYCRQIVTFTCPHIGNVGVNPDDSESGKAWLDGIVVREFNEIPSNYRSTQSLGEYLAEQGVIAISDVDTRQITHLLREHGAIGACITTDLDSAEAVERAKAFEGLEGMNLAHVVTTPSNYQWSKGSSDPDEKFAKPQSHHVVAIDYGVKRGILRCLVDEGASVTVVPATTSAQAILALNPDGIFLSNGPGDPGVLNDEMATIKALYDTEIPMFGICLGFQLLALALGAKTKKMKFGHHGGNHPVSDIQSKNVLISSQNHGFMADETTLPEGMEITHRSLFDGSLQGIRMNHAFGFQGHPEASPGPHEVMVLFEAFSDAIKKYKARSQ